MRLTVSLKLLITILVSLSLSCYSQEPVTKANRSLPATDSLLKNNVVLSENQNKPEISFSAEQSLKFLQQRALPQNWKNSNDPLRMAINELVHRALHPHFDSVRYFLEKYPYDSIRVISKDTSRLAAIDSTQRVIPGQNPFKNPEQGDSLSAAIRSLLNSIDSGDSILLSISGTGKAVTPVWLNSRSARMHRYWLKNDLDDSVTVWLGSVSRNTLGLFLEEGVSFKRPVKQGNYSKARIDLKEVDRSKLLEGKTIMTRNQFWKYRTEASAALSQTALSNWVKGGEGSVSMALDVTEYAYYENKPIKITSENYARLKYGLLATSNYDGKNGLYLMKNIDLLETNSKINHKAFGKFDFSAIFLFKTQIAKGYNYPNDSVPVSKFLNPAIITAGIGLDYKPDKNTSINFSPFSYKGTFVHDTAMIDQTKYGIPKGKRALNEPGASFMINNEFKPFKNIDVINRLQLFTNYIHNPQNIDVDWEVIATAAINWFTEVRLNTHLIFDDDTKTPLFDSDKKPVLDINGKQKNTARIQFKELLGFSFVFRF